MESGEPVNYSARRKAKMFVVYFDAIIAEGRCRLVDSAPTRNGKIICPLTRGL
jgi:hypothetical protein